MTTFFYWTAAELAISIVSICLPNVTQLFRRAHQHGFTALFTRREYAIGPENISKKRTVGSALVHGGNGGFQGIIGIDQGARWSGPLVLRPKPVQIEAIPMVRGPSEVLTGPTNLDRSRTTGPTLS